MKIMSLNANQFCGAGSWSEDNTNGVKNKDYVEVKDRIPFMNNVFLYIEKFLNENNLDENNIVILQEVPGKFMTKEYNQQYKKIREIKQAFERNYKIFYPKNTNAHEITVAITKKNSNWAQVTQNGFAEQCAKIEEDPFKNKELLYKEKAPYKNKYVELYNEKCKIGLLGVHMPIKYKCINNKYYKTLYKDAKDEFLWFELAEYAKNKANEEFIIIGDFNAYSKEDGECVYQEEYEKIIDANYKDVIEKGLCTYEKAMRKDDHILKTVSVTAIKKVEVEEVKDENGNLISDHKAIIAEFDI